MGLFEIRQARSIHSETQLEYLWQFDLIGERNDPLEFWLNIKLYLPFLAVTLNFPGMEAEVQSYWKAGEENYVLGKMKRGGPVQATFLETEDGVVEHIFREWLELADMNPSANNNSRYPRMFFSKIRKPKEEYARDGRVSLKKRSGAVSRAYVLKNLIPVKIGGYQKTYDRSGPMIIPVAMQCDEVVIDKWTYGNYV